MTRNTTTVTVSATSNEDDDNESVADFDLAMGARIAMLMRFLRG